MSKIAVIDIGSNTVRLVVFDALARAPHYVFNEKATCRLGAELGRTGRLFPEGVVAAKSALRRFVTLARAMRVATIETVATAAIREAEDGDEFRQWIEGALGIHVRVLSGEEEGAVSASGVLVGWPKANGLVCDIGGSSMELVCIENGQIGRRVSTGLGALRMRELGNFDGRQDFINAELDRAARVIGRQGDRLFLVGGSWRAFARADMYRRQYPFKILHEYALDADDVAATQAMIASVDLETLNTMTGASPNRNELLPEASQVLGATVERFAPSAIAISSYGLREGLLYEQMPRWMREADPLITACEALEAERARFPGYGHYLYHWLQPLYATNDPERDRLILAACLLHDTNWRFPSDFRAQLGFEVVAQSNLAGVNHQERIFLALALASRYEKNPSYAFAHDAIQLLDAAAITDARALGQAMRLGAMISGAVVGLLDNTRLEKRGEELILHIRQDHAQIFDSAVMRRLSSLGTIAGLTVSYHFS